MGELLTVAEAAEELELTTKRIYQLLSSHHLHSEKINGKMFIPREDVELMKRQRDLQRAGRPRVNTPPGTLPTASPETLDVVAQELSSLLLGKRALFAKALEGRVPLTFSRLRLSPLVRSYVADALRSLRKRNGESGKEEEDDPRLLTFTQARDILLGLAKVRSAISTGAYLEASLLPDDEDSDDDTLEEETLPADDTGGPQALLHTHCRAVSFLTRGEGIHLGQSMLLTGLPGSGKSRLSASLAVACALETRRPVVYYALENDVSYVIEILKQAREGWTRKWEATARATDDDISQANLVFMSARRYSRLCRQAEKTGAPPPHVDVLVQGIAGEWRELGDDLVRTLDKLPKTSAIIIDSLGPLGGHLDRNELDSLLTTINRPNRLVVLIAEESDEAQCKTSLEHSKWSVDLVVRVGYRMATDQGGLLSRYLEIMKSRRQPVIEGRHGMTIDAHAQITIFPAAETWGGSLASAERPPASTAPQYTPMFSFEREDPDLAPLNQQICLRWREGGSLILSGPRGTLKDHFSLYAASNCIAQQRSVILYNLRPEYQRMLEAWTQQQPRLRCLEIEPPIRLFEYDQATVGLEPGINIIPLKPGCAADALLWELHSGIEASFERKHPVGLVIIHHFSELMALPGISSTQLFPLMLQRLLTQRRVTSLLTIDPASYEHNVQVSRLPNMLPALDYILDLETTDTPDVVKARGRAWEVMVKLDTEMYRDREVHSLKVIPHSERSVSNWGASEQRTVG